MDFTQQVVGDEFTAYTGDGATINDSVKSKFAVDWKLVEKSDFDALAVSVGDNTGAIGVNAGAISASDTAIGINTGNISSNAGAIQGNTDAIATKGNFFTGTTALEALVVIGLTDSSFSTKTWAQSSVIIKDAMISLGGGFLFFGFDVADTTPNLRAAIIAAKGVISGTSVFEAATSTSVTDYPNLTCRINNVDNDVYISNISPFTSGTGSHEFKRLSTGVDRADGGCTALATFSDFSVRAVTSGNVTNVYGSFVLSSHTTGILFSIPTTYGKPTVKIGVVSFVSDTKFLSLSVVSGGSDVEVDYTSVDNSGVVCFVNLTYNI